tara:strand:- start:83 stop:394 length:312 start_codon:yes stop_codon:yes gene_type:complete
MRRHSLSQQKQRLLQAVADIFTYRTIWAAQAVFSVHVALGNHGFHAVPITVMAQLTAVISFISRYIATTSVRTPDTMWQRDSLQRESEVPKSYLLASGQRERQ